MGTINYSMLITGISIYVWGSLLGYQHCHRLSLGDRGWIYLEAWMTYEYHKLQYVDHRYFHLCMRFPVSYQHCHRLSLGDRGWIYLEAWMTDGYHKLQYVDHRYLHLRMRFPVSYQHCHRLSLGDGGRITGGLIDDGRHRAHPKKCAESLHFCCPLLSTDFAHICPDSLALGQLILQLSQCQWMNID